MITASCHCGAFRVEIDETPSHLTDCNCSLCRRLGALWSYFTRDQVRFLGAPDGTRGYAQGEKSLATHHCRTCGCTTHWESLRPDNPERIAINGRLFDPAVRAQIRVRRFDGADSWTYLD
jgi:hypothetical protein